MYFANIVPQKFHRLSGSSIFFRKFFLAPKFLLNSFLFPKSIQLLFQWFFVYESFLAHTPQWANIDFRTHTWIYSIKKTLYPKFKANGILWFFFMCVLVLSSIVLCNFRLGYKMSTKSMKTNRCHILLEQNILCFFIFLCSVVATHHLSMKRNTEPIYSFLLQRHL